MKGIAEWLASIGLSECAQRSADNAIDLSVVRDLTDQDLKELGVASLGHRRQLLRAITELKGGETATYKPAAEPVAPSAQRDGCCSFTATPSRDAFLFTHR